MGILNRSELRRLEKAAREKDKKHLVEWASKYDDMVRVEYDKAYHDEIIHSINVFLTAVAYTAHFSEETNLERENLPSFMEDLFVSIDMFRTGEYKPEEYQEELEKSGIYQEVYDYRVKTRRITTIVGMMDDLDIIYSKEKELTLKGYMVFINIIYQINSEELFETYKNKIRISDELYVINKNDEIPEEIQKEVDYARSFKKLVTYMEEPDYVEED